MEFLAIILVIAFIAALILPWINHARLLKKNREINELKSEIEMLRTATQNREYTSTIKRSESAILPQQSIKTPIRQPPPPLKQITKPPPPPQSIEPERTLPKSQKTTKTTSQIKSKAEELDEEPKDWFGKIAVWVGGIALLMAGFYMIKYSIDSGWLTPTVRLALTTFFGSALCAAGTLSSKRMDLQANQRIGQALSGAGITCLYFASYAAVHLFNILDSSSGFIAMISVTLLAVTLSLRNGVPIAIIGIIGGFLTPLLMNSGSANTTLLFTYLFVLYAGAQFLCIQKQWWGLLLGTLSAAYLWSGALLIVYLSTEKSSLDGAMLFILGICLLSGAWGLLSRQLTDDPKTQLLLRIIRITAWGGGLLQSAFLLYLGNFGAVDLALFSTLAIGALALASLREDEFIWAAPIAYCLILFSAFTSNEPNNFIYLGWPIGMSLIFGTVGHFLALRSSQATYWRSLSIGALTLLSPVIYLNREWFYNYTPSLPGFWLTLTGLFALGLLIAAEHLKQSVAKKLIGKYNALGFFLITFGIWISVPIAYLPHAISAIAIAICIYWKVRKLECFELAFGVISITWTITMADQIALSSDYLFVLNKVSSWNLEFHQLIAWSGAIIAFPLALFWFSRSSKNEWKRATELLLGITSLLTLSAIYRTLELTWMTDLSIDTRRGGLTAILAIISALVYRYQTKNKLMELVPLTLMGVMGFRILRLHITGAGAGGDSFFWNALILQFGLPLAASIYCAHIARLRENHTLIIVFQSSLMGLGFIWSTFLVQDFFGDAKLFSSVQTNSEMYTYSVIWLLVAIIYQTFGLIRNARAMHIGSLCLLLLTIGKVFFIDGSELVGIFRVLSFLGLGLTLITIGYFYNKVVFARNQGGTPK